LDFARRRGADSERDRNQRDNGAGLLATVLAALSAMRITTDNNGDDEVIDQSRAPYVTTRVRQQGSHGSPFVMYEPAPAAADRLLSRSLGLRLGAEVDVDQSARRITASIRAKPYLA
jgi:hypothetical protein